MLYIHIYIVYFCESGKGRATGRGVRRSILRTCYARWLNYPTETKTNSPRAPPLLSLFVCLAVASYCPLAYTPSLFPSPSRSLIIVPNNYARHLSQVPRCGICHKLLSPLLFLFVLLLLLFLFWLIKKMMKMQRSVQNVCLFNADKQQ